ncbi:MAG TPA: AAA family ATPase [Pseudobacteroides sp.]|nr:AAA family ATPase [Pseudobacteroides sp.]
MYLDEIYNYNWSLPVCPKAPDFHIDWDKIYDSFEWVRAMEGVRQDPIHHAEGDVLTHTRMVCEALAAMKEWRELNEPLRSILFAAALLHDVAKPYCTREDEGAIISPGHAVKGEMEARRIIYKDMGLGISTPFSIRETIAKLVRFHGLPLFFIEKPNPAKAVIGASQTTRMDWLAMLSKADVLGRECRDSSDLLDRVSLFTDFCSEQGCLEKPKAFPNDITRFVYFQKDNGFADFEAYDDTKSEVVLMSGLPAAGKDTWIQNNYFDYPVISLDDLRDELDVSPRDEQGEVVFKARETARTYLRRNQDFVWNATNLTSFLRRQLISLFHSYGAKVKIIYMEAPYSEIIKRNRERSRSVPENVIGRMITKLEVPDMTEAHHVEWIVK